MAAISKILKYIIITIVSVVFSCRLSAGEAVKRPDLTGVWEAFASEPAFARGEESPLSENGQQLVDAYYAQYGDKFVEPGAYCVPPGMPTTMTALVGYPIEILQSENRVTMLAEMEMQVRRIYLDGRKIPDDYPPTRMGYSVGRWEGDTLVIDTALLKEWLIRGWPRTEQTRIQERIHLTKQAQVKARRSPFIIIEPVNDDVLVIDLTMTDPTLYKAPRHVTVYYEKVKDDEILEYDCPADVWEQALDEAKAGGD